MKKLILLTAGCFLLGLGTTLAGPGCDGYYEHKTTSSWGESNNIASIESSNLTIEQIAGTSSSPLYNVKDRSGNLVASELSREDLSRQFPELY